MSESQDPQPEAPESPPAAKRTLRDRFAGTGERLRGTRGLVAATLAALIVGGVGGAAIQAAVDGDGRDGGRFSRGDHPGERGRDFGNFGERPGR